MSKAKTVKVLVEGEVAPVSLFARIVADAKEAKKEMNGELKERAIKRMFQSAYDDAEGQKDLAQIGYNSVISDLDNFDVNELVEAKATIADADLAQAAIEESYFDLFGEDLNPTA